VLALLSRGGTFAEFSETAQIARRFPNVHEVEIDCHHWPLTERPDEVRRAIESWCDDLTVVSPTSERDWVDRAAHDSRPVDQR